MNSVQKPNSVGQLNNKHFCSCNNGHIWENFQSVIIHNNKIMVKVLIQFFQEIMRGISSCIIIFYFADYVCETYLCNTTFPHFCKWCAFSTQLIGISLIVPIFVCNSDVSETENCYLQSCYLWSQTPGLTQWFTTNSNSTSRGSNAFFCLPLEFQLILLGHSHKTKLHLPLSGHAHLISVS